MMNKPVQTVQTTVIDQRIARLSALAIGFHFLEAIIPSPLPGVKPGIANIVTLYVFYRFDLVTAGWVSFFRVFVGSILLGSFLTPAFFLSFSGMLASLASLFIFRYLPRAIFGPITLSIISAFFHITAQWLLIRFWLIPSQGNVYLLPVLLGFAWIFGLINGIITAHLLRKYRRPLTIKTQV